MSDYLSFGRDREPPWRPPRWLGAAGVGVAVVLAIVLIAHQAGPSRRGARGRPGAAGAGRAPLGSPRARTPVRMAGRPLGRDARLSLLLGGQSAARLALPGDRAEPIRGLPANGSGYQLVRVADGWAALPFPAGAGCMSCVSQPLPVYYVAAGGRDARRVGTADFVAPAAAPGALWLMSYPPDANTYASAGSAQEISVTGAALGRRLRLPAGYVIDQGTRAGLLLVREGAGSGPVGYELWDPGTRRVTRSLRNVIAAAPAEIAWVPRCAASCPVHLLSLPAGHVEEISLPRRSTAYQGVFSPDGRLLALLTAARVTAAGEATATRLVVATVASGRITGVPGTTVGSANGVSFGWQPGSHELIADIGVDTPGLPEWQIALWHPGAGRLVTTLARSPYETWPVIDQGPY